jgi:hypothetical protein
MARLALETAIRSADDLTAPSKYTRGALLTPRSRWAARGESAYGVAANALSLRLF